MEELSAVGTPVVTVEATDFDSGENGRISYRILNIIPYQPVFVIDDETGIFFIASI